MKVVLVTPLDVEGLRWLHPGTLKLLVDIAEEGRLAVDEHGLLFEACGGRWQWLALVNETLAKLHEQVTV